MAKRKTVPNPYDPPQDWVAFENTATSARYPEVYHRRTLGAFEQFRQDAPNQVELSFSSGFRLQITAWTAAVWRIRYTRGAYDRLPSVALNPTIEPQNIQLKVQEEDGQCVISSAAVAVKVNKTDGRLHFVNLANDETILAETEAYQERYSILGGTHHLRTSFAAEKDEVYYGLGDKSWDLNLRGRHFQNWNSDSFGYHKEQDPLYRTIPFYYGLKASGAYGIFFHNTGRTHFDFDSRKDGVTRMWSEVGEMDYFFCFGPELDTVAQQYHYLTGTPELPPLWALGFHQCRWSYYPESRVRELATTFRELQIPCDAIYLDIDYMDGYRCFTWNKEHFPQPGEMIRDLAEEGFQTVVMIDPGIRVDPDYHVYAEGTEQDYFCRRSSGEVMEGPVWPPMCVWPDYSRQEVRDWWGNLYQELYNENSISGFWNDMNEPAVFQVNSLTFPDNVIHDNDGHPRDHRSGHNVYGLQMSQGTYDGLKKLQPQKRPFVLTRATYSGGQRFAAVWTGDNVASWEHLELANRQCQRLSISGFSMVGTDIGGFVDQPSPELLVRWIQLGVFHPVFRVHSMGNNIDGAAETDQEMIKLSEAQRRLDQEPWVFGEPYTSQARRAIEFRYRLLPYLYTSVYQQVKEGRPVLRSLSFVDQHDKKAQQAENEFLLGEHLLVSPVVRKGAKSHSTWLPQGEWLNFYTGKKQAGRRRVRQRVTADSIPLYVRAGGIIPHYPVQQYVYEQAIENVELRVYHGSAKSSFYYDAGEGYAYRNGDYALHQFETVADEKSVKVTQQKKGQLTGDLATFELKFFGLPFKPEQLLIDGMQIQVIDEEKNAYVVVAPVDFERVELSA